MENFVVASGEGVQKHPVEGAGHQSDVELVVVEEGVVEVLEHGVVHVVLAESEEAAPRDDRGQNIEEKV